MQNYGAKAFTALLCVVSVFVTTAAKKSNTEREALPSIGDKVNKHWDKTKNKLCVIHPSQMDPCFEWAIADVRYTIAYGRGNGKVSYVYTDEKNFKTSENLKVGDPVTFSAKNLLALPGWLVIGPATQDGWRTVIGLNAEVRLTDGTTLDLRTNQDRSGTAYVLGFCKDRYFH